MPRLVVDKTDEDFQKLNRDGQQHVISKVREELKWEAEQCGEHKKVFGRAMRTVWTGAALKTPGFKL